MECYHSILKEVAKVYDHITGGLLSSASYSAEDVIRVANEHINKLIHWDDTECPSCEYPEMRPYYTYCPFCGKKIGE